MGLISLIFGKPTPEQLYEKLYEAAHATASSCCAKWEEMFGPASHKQSALIWAIVFYGTMDGHRFRNKFTAIDDNVVAAVIGRYPEAFIEWRKTKKQITNPTAYLIIGEAYFKASKTAQLFADLVNIGRSPKTVLAAIPSFFSAGGGGQDFSLGTSDLDAYAGSMIYNFYFDGYMLVEKL
jgi:hypothetical protein